MTVIRGITMYQSTGYNSKQKAIWLPHLGIDGTHWIRKPRFCLDKKITEYCKAHNLNQEIHLFRLGNALTCCISASLGGGFWEQDKGNAFRDFLFMHYHQYFLSNEEILQIKTLQSQAGHITISQSKEANELFLQAGCFTPVHSHKGRLPKISEYYYFTQTVHPLIHSAMQMLLLNKKNIDDLVFQALSWMATQPNLIQYALKVGLFEVTKQVRALITLFSKNKQLTLEDLSTINQLNSIQLPEKYLYLMHEYPCRKAFRLLKDQNLIHENLELIKSLHKKHYLERFTHLLLNKEARCLLLLLSKCNQLTRENIMKINYMVKNTQVASETFIQEILERKDHTDDQYLNKFSLFSHNEGDVKEEGQLKLITNQSLS